MTFDVGPKFRGIGMIPKGLHFVYYSCGMGLRQGCFIDLNTHEIIVRSWNPKSESISAANVLSESSTDEFMKSLYRGELNEFIGAYNADNHHTWQNLSKFITCDVLNKCKCASFGGSGSSGGGTADFTSVTLYPGEDEDIETELLKVMSRPQNPKVLSEHVKFKDKYVSSDAEPPQVPVYIDLPVLEKQYCVSAVSAVSATDPSRVSSFHLDKSSFLEYLLKREYSGSWGRLLGELQLSFILFLNLYSAPSLKHWQRIISLICQCEEFLHDNSEFTACFIRLLFHQLNFAPYDFFLEEISKNNFLRSSLSNLMRSLQVKDGAEADMSEGEDGEEEEEEDQTKGITSAKTVQECKRRFLVFLRKKFGLFDRDGDELGDYFDRLWALSKHSLSVGPRAGAGAGAGVPEHVAAVATPSRATLCLSADELYSLELEDLPVVVDADEFQRYEELQAQARQAQAQTEAKIQTQEPDADGNSMAVEDNEGPAISLTPAKQKWSAIDEKLAAIQIAASTSSAPSPASVAAATVGKEQDGKFRHKDAGSASKTIENSGLPFSSAGGASSLTDAELARERSVFGWRYPLLCDESAQLSALRNTKLDLMMTARLVLDEYVCDTPPHDAETIGLPSTPSAFLDETAIKLSFLRRVREEAVFFLQNESRQ